MTAKTTIVTVLDFKDALAKTKSSDGFFRYGRYTRLLKGSELNPELHQWSSEERFGPRMIIRFYLLR